MCSEKTMLFIYYYSFCLQQVKNVGFKPIFSSFKELSNVIKLQGSW